MAYHKTQKRTPSLLLPVWKGAGRRLPPLFLKPRPSRWRMKKRISNFNCDSSNCTARRSANSRRRDRVTPRTLIRTTERCTSGTQRSGHGSPRQVGLHAHTNICALDLYPIYVYDWYFCFSCCLLLFCYIFLLFLLFGILLHGIAMVFRPLGRDDFVYWTP